MIEATWIVERLSAAGFLLRAREGDRPIPIRGARQDSRGLRAGELFVALTGENADGHRYAAAALDAGASGAILSDPRRFEQLSGTHPDAALFLVEDVLAALQRLAADHLSRVAPDLVAVTGSNGKTGTKDLCRALLATLGPTFASEGNFNNTIGLPMTLLAMPLETRYAVVEMGCSSFGEIARLCELFPPRVGIITNIGHAHLEILGDLDGVARAKGEMAEALSPSGLLILNGDDDYAGRLAARSRAAVKRFGRGENLDLRLDDRGPLPGNPARRSVAIDGRQLVLNSPWSHGQLSLGAAWLAAGELGAEAPAMAAAAEALRAETNRGGVYRLGAWTVVDDSYNANPDSMKAALDWLAEIPTDGKRWALLGDMLELGEEGPALHRRLGEHAASLGLDGLAACGPLCVELAAGARAGGLEARHYPDAAALAAELPALLGAGDLILVKGSRGMAMETTIAALEKRVGETREIVT